ncbi:Brix-domain-containing protein [Delitschia confertaspora ATCC 74209]|uniref:Brix-domain-containing protein n=1 Tax=Delitschia confertaspora ATCC 74209 TaxID=1513339 RepID=A0A9P4JX78_9PLEO|nr:Brix-domain-containing protein [Delitschia confertaspora ATCC 74209]
MKPKNKARRQAMYVAHKKSKDSAKRDERFRRRREEDQDPTLREERRARNVPATIDSKRTWDEMDGDEGDALGWSVDVERAKRLKKEAEENGEGGGILEKLKKRDQDEADEDEDEIDSMLDSDSDSDDGSDASSSAPNSKSKSKSKKDSQNPPPRSTSPAASTATNLELSPEFLRSKFPTIFDPPLEPKILITGSLHSTLHHEAEILTSLFPNSTYIRRTAHAHAHKYSVREIAKFASNRGYTCLLVLMEDQKKPSGLDIVHLPEGPHFHFTISNWVEGKKLPGHGNPTGHIPELILNNFRTPLGLLSAHLFRGLFPSTPEIVGRTVVTLHNQRDYIFVRRHRYVFRDKRETEKSIVGTDGKVVKGIEDIKAGLQELGPRFTLKLRRVDRGIQYRSGQEWEWKGKMEKERTRFAM